MAAVEAYKVQGSDLSPDAKAEPKQSHTKTTYDGKNGNAGNLRITKEVPRLKLFLISVPEYGHLYPLIHLGTELAKRGHDVSLLTCDFVAEKVGKLCSEGGCRFIGLLKGLEAPESGSGTHGRIKKKQCLLELYSWYCIQFEEEIRKCIVDGQPDMGIVDLMNFKLFDVYDELKLPYIVNMPGPSALLRFVESALTPWILPPLIPIIFNVPWSEAFPGFTLFTACHARVHTNVWIINSFYGFEAPVKTRPNMIIAGPPAPRCLMPWPTPLEPLNHWVEWVRAEKLQIIYVTMGSMMQLNSQQVNALYSGLCNIPGCAVLWSLKKDQQILLPGEGACLPKKFFVHDWLPQNQALQMEEVAVVITHCGWGGTMETITAGKPVVATPFANDQPENAQLLKSHGMAEILNVKTMTEKVIQSTVSKVLLTPKYAEVAKQLQAALLRSGGAPELCDKIEFFAQHGFQDIVGRPPSVTLALAKVAGVLFLTGAVIGAFRPSFTRLLRGSLS